MTIIGSGSDATNEQDHGIIEMMHALNRPFRFPLQINCPTRYLWQGGVQARKSSAG